MWPKSVVRVSIQYYLFHIFMEDNKVKCIFVRLSKYINYE